MLQTVEGDFKSNLSHTHTRKKINLKFKMSRIVLFVLFTTIFSGRDVTCASLGKFIVKSKIATIYIMQFRCKKAFQVHQFELISETVTRR